MKGRQAHLSRRERQILDALHELGDAGTRTVGTVFNAF